MIPYIVKTLRKGAFLWEKRLRRPWSACEFSSLEVGLKQFVSPDFKIIELNNELIISGYYIFDYEKQNHPELAQLRDYYDLKKIIHKDHMDYQRAWSVANWLRCQMDYGDPIRPFFHRFNALEILQRAREGEKFRCGGISCVFVQCLLSLGIQARLLNIENPSGKAHVVTEVWCDKKWVIFDVDNNVSYLVKGEEASAHDLHQLWINSAWDEAELVNGSCQHVKPSDIQTYQKVDFYWHFAVRMNNNWLSRSRPSWHPRENRILGDLEWVDVATPPRIDRAWTTNRVEDLYWTINQVQIFLKGFDAEKGCLVFHFVSTVPNHCKFQMVDNGNFHEGISSDYTFHLKPGLNEFQVWSVDVLGYAGRKSNLAIEV